MCDTFITLIDANIGRIVNVSSELGPSYVRSLKKDNQKFFFWTDVTWEEIEEYVKQNLTKTKGAFGIYGLSKACLNSYTMVLAKNHPNILSSSIHPGFCNTTMTKGMGATRTAD